ncbi:MAG: DUF3419 family protein [Candidatus Binatia bacterium]
MAAETPWEAGRFDRRGGQKKVLFGRMYEDPLIEEEALGRGGRVFCIASAGCTAMKLAERHDVVAVDINPVQLRYAERRLAGEPMQIGTAERIMSVGRALLPIAGWRRGTIEAFLDLANPAEQIEFWNRRLNTMTFRIGFDAMFSVTGLRALYASPFLDILPPHFGRVMRGRMERCFRTHPNRSNPYARALLLGELSPEPRAAAAHPIQLVLADAASYLESCAPRSFDGFTLSNVLDGAGAGYRDRLFAAIKRAATRDSVVVLRSFAEPTEQTVNNQAARDRSVLWGIVDVRPASAL